MFWFKSCIPDHPAPGVIYKLHCALCNRSYYGECERHLNIRKSQQTCIAPLTQKKVKPNNSLLYTHELFCDHSSCIGRDGNRDFEKEGRGWALYAGQHGWPAKIVLDFRWSKKVEMTFETISSWQNISISIFKLYPFLWIKSYQFFKISNSVIRKEKKH